MRAGSQPSPRRSRPIPRCAPPETPRRCDPSANRESTTHPTNRETLTDDSPPLPSRTQPVPNDLAPRVVDAIASALNAKTTVTTVTSREQCARLVSAIASHPWNVDVALECLRRCDEAFEFAFEGEELHCDVTVVTGHSKRGRKGKRGVSSAKVTWPLHLHVTVAMLRIFGDSFGAPELLEMHRDDCDAAVVATLQLLDHAVSSSQGDASRLASRACGLLHALTTPQAHFLEGDRNETPMTELAKRFRRIVGDLTRAFIERDAPRRFVSALEALHRIVSSSKGSSREDADALLRAATSAAIKATRNLLLHTDERGAQLRKALAQSEMTIRVLEPFLARAVRDVRRAEASLDDEEDDGGGEDRRGPLHHEEASDSPGWRERRVYERSRALRNAVGAVADALNALVVATHKDGTLRQRLLCGVGDPGASAASLIPGGVLAVEALACNLHVVDALLRLACNLGVGVGDDGGGAPAKAGRERWTRQLTERCVNRLDDDAAVILATRFAEETRSAPVVRDCKTHEWLVSLLPEPTAPRMVVEAALKGGGGGGGGGGRRRNRRGGKSQPGVGGSKQRPGLGGGKTEKERARKREQKRRKKRREKEAKEAGRRRDEASVEGESASAPAIARSPPPRVVGCDAAQVIEVRRSTPKVEDDEVVSDDGDGDEGSSLGGDSSGDDVRGVNEFKIGFGASSSQRPVFVNPMFDSKEDTLEGVDKLLEEVDRLGF